MKTKTLLMECKKILKVDTDYKLAKALEISRQQISHYMRGARKPNAYAVKKIAECLGKSMEEITAEVELDHDTNTERKKFWRSVRNKN